VLRLRDCGCCWVHRYVTPQRCAELNALTSPEVAAAMAANIAPALPRAGVRGDIIGWQKPEVDAEALAAMLAVFP
jgi:hypothetical protein